MANSIADILRSQAQRRPSSTAISGEGRSITYGELDARSSQLANALVERGVARGDRVAYIDRNATEFWETAFAAAKIGAVITPLNFRLSAPEIATILRDSEPSAVVIADSVLERAGARVAPDADHHLGRGPRRGAGGDPRVLLRRRPRRSGVSRSGRACDRWGTRGSDVLLGHHRATQRHPDHRGQLALCRGELHQ